MLKKKQKKLEHQCFNCENLNQLNNTCSDCKLLGMPKWTSGNYDVDKTIQMTQSDENSKQCEIWRWIDYSKLKNIEYLAEGGFGSIWKAEWIDMPKEVFEFYKSNQVALKKLRISNSQEISSDFSKEVNIKYVNMLYYIFILI
jgi:serine/threonine protein kinase